MKNENIPAEKSGSYSILLNIPIPNVLGTWGLKFYFGEENREFVSKFRFNTQKYNKDGIPFKEFPKTTIKSIDGILDPWNNRILPVSDYVEYVKKDLERSVEKSEQSQAWANWRLNRLEEGLTMVFSDYEPRYFNKEHDELFDDLSMTDQL